MADPLAGAWIALDAFVRRGQSGCMNELLVDTRGYRRNSKTSLLSVMARMLLASVMTGSMSIMG